MAVHRDVQPIQCFVISQVDFVYILLGLVEAYVYFNTG